MSQMYLFCVRTLLDLFFLFLMYKCIFFWIVSQYQGA